jgi:drug/metabolite transporter (DMT)-like permease
MVAFVALGTIWGSNFITMKWATQEISPQQVSLLRVVFGLLPVLAYGLVRRVYRRAHLRRAHHFFVMSILATSLYVYAFAAGTQRLPSAIAGVLSGAIPLFSFVAAALFLRTERITFLRLAGVLIGFSGVVLVARPWEASDVIDPVGVVLMLVGSASVGLSFVYARKFLSGVDIPPVALTTYQMGFALLILLSVTNLRGITSITDDRRALVGLVVGLGLLGTGIAYVLYYFIVDALGAVTASGVSYLPPVVALAIGWLAVGEPLVWTDAIAVALILCGVLIIRLGAMTPKPPALSQQSGIA